MATSTRLAQVFPTATQLTQLAKTAKYSPGRLTKLCGYARKAWQLRREFRRRYNCSLRAWLHQARIKEAEARLLSGQRPKDMINDLGFVDLPHLSHAFKQWLGRSPSQFLRLQLQDQKCSKLTNDCPKLTNESIGLCYPGCAKKVAEHKT
jgi:AraC-like DNA-binding protein